jgi:hypothetical protein
MSIPEVEEPPLKERWGRMPRPGGRLSGLPLSTIDRLTRPSQYNNYDPPVESKVICITGTKRGVRLVNLDALDRWIQSQSAESIEAPARPKRRQRKLTPKPKP